MENASGDDAPIRDLMSELGGEAQADSRPRESPSASERRRSPRIDVKLPVTVRILIEEGTVVYVEAHNDKEYTQGCSCHE